MKFPKSPITILITDVNPGQMFWFDPAVPFYNFRIDDESVQSLLNPMTEKTAWYMSMHGVVRSAPLTEQVCVIQ